MLFVFLRNKKITYQVALILGVFLLAVTVPLTVAHAQPFGLSNLCRCGVPDCDFGDLMNLGKRIIDFLILLSIPLATIAFAYAGYLFLTSAGNPGQVSDAKKIFGKVLWGFFFVLTAWLIVRTITSAVLTKGMYFDPFTDVIPTRACPSSAAAPSPSQ